jgi:hypothetical protein
LQVRVLPGPPANQWLSCLSFHGLSVTAPEMHRFVAPSDASADAGPRQFDLPELIVSGFSSLGAHIVHTPLSNPLKNLKSHSNPS